MCSTARELFTRSMCQRQKAHLSNACRSASQLYEQLSRLQDQFLIRDQMEHSRTLLLRLSLTAARNSSGTVCIDCPDFLTKCWPVLHEQVTQQKVTGLTCTEASVSALSGLFSSQSSSSAPLQLQKLAVVGSDAAAPEISNLSFQDVQVVEFSASNVRFVEWPQLNAQHLRKLVLISCTCTQNPWAFVHQSASGLEAAHLINLQLPGGLPILCTEDMPCLKGVFLLRLIIAICPDAHAFMT